MSEGATLFFGGKPVEFILNAEDEVVSFTVPAMLPGDKKIYFQEGDGGTTPLGSFEISGAGTASGGEAVAPSDTPSTPTTPEGDEIVPSGTGGSTTGSMTPDDFAGTTGGSTGGSTGGGTSGGTPEPAALSATLTVQKQFDTRLGLVKLNWNVTGGDEISELYIYGGFYRIEGDNAASNPCGKIEDAYGKRNLLVHSDGNDLNDGSPNFNTWNKFMSSAQECTSGTNCKGYTPPTALKDPDGNKYFTRALLAKLEMADPNITVMEKADHLDLYLTPELLLADHPPYCRMDLKNAGAFVKSGEMYTRLLTRTPFTLYAKTASGEEKKITVSVPDLPDANITATVDVLNDQPKIKFTANYGYALLPVNAPAGCTKSGGNYSPKGSGMVEATCPLSKSQQLTVSAVGIGQLGSDTKTFKIEADSIQKEFKPTTFTASDSTLCNADTGDWWKNCPKAGTLKLFGYATRSFTVSEKDGSNWVTVGSPKKAPWVKGIRVKAFKYDGSSCGEVSKSIDDLTALPSGVSVAVDGRLLLKADLPRSHNCSRYELSVQDLDSSWSSASSLEAPYQAQFDLSNGSTGASYDCMIDDCDAWGESDCCDSHDCGACPSSNVHDCTNHKTTGAFNWSGRHIKSVTSTCGGSFSGSADGGNYELQTGNWTNSVDGTSMNCEIKATTWDDQTITRTFNAGPWDDNC